MPDTDDARRALASAMDEALGDAVTFIIDNVADVERDGPCTDPDHPTRSHCRGAALVILLAKSGLTVVPTGLLEETVVLGRAMVADARAERQAAARARRN